MSSIFELIYHEGEPLYTLCSIFVLAFTFEFILSFAYILRSTKSGVSV